jgi:hypothetical protein
VPITAPTPKKVFAAEFRRVYVRAGLRSFWVAGDGGYAGKTSTRLQCDICARAAIPDAELSSAEGGRLVGMWAVDTSDAWPGTRACRLQLPYRRHLFGYSVSCLRRRCPTQAGLERSPSALSLSLAAVAVLLLPLNSLPSLLKRACRRFIHSYPGLDVQLLLGEWSISVGDGVTPAFLSRPPRLGTVPAS